ncbi:agmatine deiminase family protein [Streptomyces sp. NPDC056224]|uniref:agmatine deiminase family protein n=1 Tax=Streptomyces sp. NPDC056224 TaxID=3345750 RepID=UPI0035D634AA
MTAPSDDVRHLRTWMAWPSGRAVWGPDLAGVQQDIALIARTVARYEPVLMCAAAGAAATARARCGSAVTVISSVPVDDLWMRDTGPVFRRDDAGAVDPIGLGFNGWGRKQTHRKDAGVAGRVAAFPGRAVVQLDVDRLTGGSGGIHCSTMQQPAAG